MLNRYNVVARNRGFYSIGKPPPNKLFTVEIEKEQIIQEYKIIKSHRKLADKYGVSKPTVGKILATVSP